MTTHTMTVSIDWIEYTIPELDPLAHLANLHITSDLTELKGGLGYSKSLRHESGMTIYFDGREDMGVHVKFTGSSLRRLPFTHEWIFIVARQDNAAFTRIDIALDLHNHDFTIDHVYSKHKAGLLSMLWQEITHLESTDRGGALTGRTLYFGSRQSNVFARFYDKYLESKKSEYKGVERLELELKKDAAEIYATQLYMGRLPQDIMIDILYKYLKVKDHAKGKNKARWPDCPAYLDIIKGAEKIKMTIPKEPLTIERAKEIYWKQSAGLAYTIAAYDDSTEFLEACRTGAGYRLSQRHKDLLAEKEMV